MPDAKQVKDCPYCGGEIKTGAIKCKYCKSMINHGKHLQNKFINAPVISDPTKRGNENEFRLENDDENVIRINQKQPKGCPKKVAEFVPVVGISMDNRELILKNLILGHERRIELKKEPNNQYDKNAIAVYGHYINIDIPITCKLGYLPAEIAKKLKKYDELKATIKVMYYPTRNKKVGVRLDIWSKRAPSKKIIEKEYIDIKIPKNIFECNILILPHKPTGYKHP